MGYLASLPTLSSFFMSHPLCRRPLARGVASLLQAALGMPQYVVAAPPLAFYWSNLALYARSARSRVK
jgi:hypothetical protein